MPKIGKHEFMIAGERHFLDIVYLKKEKKFSIKMPPNMAKALRGWSPDDQGKWKNIDVIGTTENEAVEAFEKEIKDYHAAVTKKDKVILYAVAGASNDLHSPLNDLEKISRELGNWGRGPSEWIGLLIKHRVAYKTTVDSQITYRDEDGSEVAFSWRPQKDKDLIKVMPWTKGREDFFITLQKQLESMVERAVTILATDSELMMSMIDTKRVGLLLAGPKA